MSHIIKRQILELELPSGSDSWRLQNEFSVLLNQKVLPRLEKACDDLGIDKNTTISIDKLFLDTGIIKEFEMQSSWADNIEFQFREQLKRLKFTRATGDKSVDFKTTEQSDFQALLSYLKKGVLPWWASKERNLKPTELLKKAIESQPGQLATAIKRSRNNQIVLERIVRQSEAELVVKLLKSWGVSDPVFPKLRSTLKTFEISEKESKLISQSSAVTELVMALEGKTDLSTKKLFLTWIDSVFQRDNHITKLLIGIFNSLYIRELKQENKALLNNSFTTQFVAVLVETVGPKVGFPTTKRRLSTSSSQQKQEQKPGWKEENKGIARVNKNDSESPGKETQSSFAKEDPERQQPSPSPENGLTENRVSPSSSSSSPVDSTANSNQQDSVASTSSTKKQQPAATQKQEPDKAGKVATSDQAQDQHVRSQLERIRKQALEKISEQSGSKASSSDKTAENSKPVDTRNKPESREEVKSAPLNEAQAASEKAQRANSEEATTRQPTNHSIPKENFEQRDQYPYDLSGIEEVDECYIENAGLVLFWPYLSRFFRNLNLMEGSHFLSLEQQERAALMLQCLLGEAPSTEEYRLPLNKLLCALPIEHPMETKLEINKEQRQHCQDLLESTISYWTALKGTSVAGFQGSFLNRAGVLRKRKDGWLLQVEKMAFDMLLEQLPWPVSIVKLTWMDKPIYVEW